MIRPIIATICLVTLSQWATAQTSPCIRVAAPLAGTTESNTTCTPDTDVFNSDNQFINFNHLNPTAGLEGTDTATSYRAFWILGDGNFILHPDRHKAANMATLNQNYTYHRSGFYNARSVLLEKKSNRQPPDKKDRPVNVKVPGPLLPTGTPFTAQLSGNNRAALLTSSDVRLGGYETALVVSSKLPSSASNTVAVVLYNSVRAGSRTATTFSAGEVFPTVDVEKPNYLSNDLPEQLGRASQMNNTVRDVMNTGGYGNFIVQRYVDNNDLRPAAFNEFRIFPVFKTKMRPATDGVAYDSGVPSLNVDGTGETQFLTLILENVSLNPDFNPQNVESQVFNTSATSAAVSPITGAEKALILSLLGTHASSLLVGMDTATLRLANGMYVRGVAHQTARIVSSIDPTELKVLSICAGEGGQYDVKMRMTICNEGNLDESKVTTQIKNVEGVQVLDANFDQTGLINFNYTPPSWQFEYHNLPGAYNAAGAFKEDNSNCIARDFTFKTDWAGAQKLANKGAMVATVNFFTALINPTRDFPSEMDYATQLSKENGYNCNPSSPNPQKTDGNYWWLYVVLFALALVAWWWWKMKKEEEGN
jgi:copper chaperone CopZ